MSTPLSLTSLPTELINEILLQIRRSALVALCLVGDCWLNTCCVPHIYSALSIADLDQLMQFCTTLNLCSELGEKVESLRVESPPYSDFQENKAPHRINTSRRNKAARAAGELHQIRSVCTTTMASLCNVIHLQTTHFDFLPFLSPISFPRLRHLGAALTDHLLPFLHAHPDLESLVVKDPRAMEHNYVLPRMIANFQLPTLRSFNGPESLVCAILPGSRVTSTTVFWDNSNLRQVSATECLITLSCRVQA
ncbi:hypothetical protein DFH09DRAFT_1081082 [Mycena vulgaris]|nr:hypothetical protein DFH09DRAFT_1081082 [Mycena vulgaris]